MASHRQRTLPDAGSRAPDFRLAWLEGGETSLAEILAGGPALMVFFKITCPVTQMALPGFWSGCMFRADCESMASRRTMRRTRANSCSISG